MNFLFLQIENNLLPCVNKSLFGIDCPGCGFQRSLVLLFKGEFTEAFFMYPAIYTLILLGLIFLLNKFFPLKKGKKIIYTLAYVNVAIIVISYIIKMNTLYQLI